MQLLQPTCFAVALGREDLETAITQGSAQRACQTQPRGISSRHPGTQFANLARSSVRLTKPQESPNDSRLGFPRNFTISETLPLILAYWVTGRSWETHRRAPIFESAFPCISVTVNRSRQNHGKDSPIASHSWIICFISYSLYYPAFLGPVGTSFTILILPTVPSSALAPSVAPFFSSSMLLSKLLGSTE